MDALGADGSGGAVPGAVLEILATAARGPGATEAARAMGPGRSLGLEIAGDEATLTTTADGVDVARGIDDVGLVVAMDREAFDDLVAEERSIFGLLYASRLAVTCGDFDRFAAWEPALQALLYGRAVFDSSSALPDDVDVTRVWSIDDDPVAMAAALDLAGFLHLGAVFAPDEIAEMSEEAERLRSAAVPGDRTSWWAGLEDGTEVCCRVTYMSQRSSTFARLADDPRLARIAALTGLDVRVAPDRNDGVSVVIKNPGAVSGLSDLPWHRDCGLGGHPRMCPGVLLGINLDRADAERGQLWFLPGSHRHAGPVGDPVAGGHRVVAIDAEPGDVTIHHQHALHAAPPPVARSGSGRRAVYVGFEREELFRAVDAGRAYNDVLYTADGSVRNVAQVSA